jgi:methionyl-tRNA formyltransferase
VLRILLVAEEGAGSRVLRAVAESGQEIIGILTGAEGGRASAAVASTARRLSLPLLPTELFRAGTLPGWIEEHAVDLLTNVHSLVVLPGDVVRAPRIGSFNVHPGPLPEYAGLNAPSWAIFNGERSHAVTLDWMDEGIDTGPIAFSRSFPIRDDDTGLSLSLRCAREGVELVSELVAAASGGVSTVPRIAQDTSRRRYFGPRPPLGGRIDWARPAAEIVRFVRAADYTPFPSPWGHPRAEIGGRDVGVVAVLETGESHSERPGTVLPSDEGLLVGAGGEWVLVTRVELGGERVPAGSVVDLL